MQNISLNREQPIAVMDSGLGGISVLRELVSVMPGERYLYFGDSKNAPYGEKPPEVLLQLCRQNIDLLLRKGAKCVVVACNTATSAAVPALREEYSFLPIIGMEPAVKPAAQQGAHPRVLVLATPLTIEGDRLHHLVEAHAEDAEFILKAAPEIVRFVESGVCDAAPTPELRTYLRDLLAEFRLPGRRLDAVVLGCTHFPFVREGIRNALGYDAAIYDGAHGTAMQTRRRLLEAGLLSEYADAKDGTIRAELLNSDADKLPAERMLFRLPGGRRDCRGKEITGCRGTGCASVRYTGDL